MCRHGNWNQMILQFFIVQYDPPEMKTFYAATESKIF